MRHDGSWPIPNACREAAASCKDVGGRGVGEVLLGGRALHRLPADRFDPPGRCCACPPGSSAFFEAHRGVLGTSLSLPQYICWRELVWRDSEPPRRRDGPAVRGPDDAG